MNVLVSHECNGRVAAAFRARGHNAWSNDVLPASDGSRFHLQMDWRAALKLERWDLLIGHPVCTYLCNSGVSRLHRVPPNPAPGVLYGRERWEAMRAAANEFADMLLSDVELIALENPVMHGHAWEIIARRLGARDGGDISSRPAQTIQPYHFGDDASKRTGLWLKRLRKLRIPHESQWSAPRLVCMTCRVVGLPPAYREMERCGCRDEGLRRRWLRRWGNQTDSGQNALAPSSDRAAIRSATYPGVALAFADNWG